jgi:hypothetical protein
MLMPLVLAAPAKAAGTYYHTWVSNTGTDNGTCGSLASPCATFSGAYNNTAVGGEITCLNGGDYLTLTISNSITIDCQYSIGRIGSAQDPGNSIVISPPAGGVVTLRGLDLDFAGDAFLSCGTGSGAIYFTGGGVLHLQKMKINHDTGDSCSGIYFAPRSNATLDITDSDITDNGSGGTNAGIHIVPASGVQANVTITRTQVQGNYFGIFADGRSGGIIKGAIKGSVVSGNTENGITALSSGSSVVFTIDQTEISGNLAGLFAGGSNAGILARNSTVYGNAIGLDAANGGTLYTYGNNSVNGNTTNGAFTGTAGLQ